MANGVERGVLIDEEGFFVAALQWEAGSPAPKFREKLTRGKAPTFMLLREPYAIENVEPGARWDFQPVREPVDPGDPEKGTRQVRSGSWLMPPETRWVVNVRRDIPSIGSLSGSRKVWPERLPGLPSYQRWVTVAPPETRSAKPIFDFDRGEWVLPSAVWVVDGDGVVLNKCTSVVPGDVQVPADGATVPCAHEAMPTDDGLFEDEVGERVPLEIGDVVALAKDRTSVLSVVRKRPRNYPEFPVRIVRRVLRANGKLASFLAFAASQGLDEDDLEALGTMGLGTKVLRDWIHSDGLTKRQAWQGLNAALTEAHEGEVERLRGQKGAPT